MDNTIDDRELVKKQYKNADNLSSRISIYKYNINKEDFHKWCFDRMRFPQNAKILELGCGNGVFWLNNQERIRDDLIITLSDFSDGMIDSAKTQLKTVNKRISYEKIDVQDIPHEDKSFDIVIAKHMLYHVPDLDKALSEIKRVLADGGTFYATTNAKEHLSELHDITEKYDPQLTPNSMAEKFGLDSGKIAIMKYFKHVRTQVFEGRLVITDAEPIVSFMSSTLKGASMLVGDKREDFKKYVLDIIKQKGSISITTKSCLFTAND